MKPELILIANASIARFFQRESDKDPLVVLPALDHPEGHFKATELADDRPGHGSSDARPGGVAFTPRVDPHTKESRRFANQLAERVDEAIAAGCGHLLVFASTPFLGELKEALSPAAKKVLRAAVDIDLTSYGVDEIERRIAHALHA